MTAPLPRDCADVLDALSLLETVYGVLPRERAPAAELVRSRLAEVYAQRDEHVRLLRRVQYVRGLTGNAKAQAWDKLDREIDAALARCTGTQP